MLLLVEFDTLDLFHQIRQMVVLGELEMDLVLAPDVLIL